MLTLEQFDAIPYGEVIATGILPNSEDGLFMERSMPNDDLRWVAKKGSGNDWAIYCHWATNSPEWVKENGDKVTFESHIKKCVPCTDEVFNKYRY